MMMRGQQVAVVVMCALWAMACSSAPGSTGGPDASLMSVDSGAGLDLRSMDSSSAVDSAGSACIPVRASCTPSTLCCGATDICSLRGARDFTECCGPAGGACDVALDCCGAMDCDLVSHTCVLQTSGQICQNDADCVSNQCVRPVGTPADMYGACT